MDAGKISKDEDYLFVVSQGGRGVLFLPLVPFGAGQINHAGWLAKVDSALTRPNLVQDGVVLLDVNG